MTTPLTLEQRIAIAADFNTDRIEGIKELMEDNAIAFAEWKHRNFKVSIGGFVHVMGDLLYRGAYDTKGIYELYLLQSNKQVKP